MIANSWHTMKQTHCAEVAPAVHRTLVLSKCQKTRSSCLSEAAARKVPPSYLDHHDCDHNGLLHTPPATGITLSFSAERSPEAQASRKPLHAVQAHIWIQASCSNAFAQVTLVWYADCTTFICLMQPLHCQLLGLALQPSCLSWASHANRLLASC